MKKALTISVAVLAILGLSFFVFSARTSNNKENYQTNEVQKDQEKIVGENEALEEKELPLMTIDSVSKYDGKNGARAYIVVNNIVYDVTDSPRWANGSHNGFEAGKDLTKEIENISPHGVGVLERIEKVGRISN
jgi:predicted heme/steroid binding protein